MRIVSLNAWGGASWDALAAWLPAARADVLCLQEVTRTPGLTGWTSFTDGVHELPQRADLFDDVARILPDHDGIFDASDAGPVVVDGRRFHQQFGLGLFAAGAVQWHGTRFVHGAYADHDEWPTDGRPRVAQAVRVDGVLVVHVHGLRVGAGKHDTPERIAQAERLAAFVTAVRAGDELVVLCGDLNLLPDSRTFDILGAVGLVDLVGDADTRTSRYAKPTRHASYLLVSDPAAVRDFEIVAQPEVSDHRALALTI